MNDADRFSVLNLEKDVLEYTHYKKKFREYEQKVNSRWHYFSKKRNEEEKMKWYNKYISKMNYLEKTYRKNKIYTKYHAELEQPYLREEPVVATVVNNALPTAPSYSNMYDYELPPPSPERFR